MIPRSGRIEGGPSISDATPYRLMEGNLKVLGFEPSSPEAVDVVRERCRQQVELPQRLLRRQHARDLPDNESALTAKTIKIV